MKHCLVFVKTGNSHPLRQQFSVTISWACTVHKVQGLSLTEGVVSFGLEYAIPYGYSNEIKILSYEHFDDISIFTLKKYKFSNSPILITLI